MTQKDEARKAQVKAKRSTVVKVFGRDYRLRSDESEESVQRIASYVDEKMQELAASIHSPDPLGVAVLTAMNVAGELLPSKEDRQATAGITAERVRRLISLVDGALGQTAPQGRRGR